MTTIPAATRATRAAAAYDAAYRAANVAGAAYKAARKAATRAYAAADDVYTTEQA